MKTTTILLGLIFLCSGLFAQQPAFIDCKIEKNLLKEIQLYKIQDGMPVSIAKANSTGDGYFGFQFIPPYEGFYMVGDDFKNQYPVYLKPGDHASIYIGEAGAQLEGKKNTRENRILYSWMDLSHYVSSRSVKFYQYRECSYKEYFPKFEQFLTETETFRKKVRSGNARFDELMMRSIDFEKDYYLLAFMQAYRKKEYRNAEEIEYYSSIINPDKLRDTVLLQMPYGMRFLNRYTLNAAKPQGKKSILHALIEEIPNEQLKGELILKEAALLKSYGDYLKVADEFEHLLTETQKSRLEMVGASLYDPQNGNKAENFTYPDANGKMVSLSDFLGKVIVVDVWATWCAPCRAQIPHLKKLEEEMSGKDVVFIGVSVDKAKDIEKWKKMLKDMELEGIQLFADEGKQIRTAYKIEGIPRFMVFDRQGNSVDTNAPRPSKPELKELIERTLKK